MDFKNIISQIAQADPEVFERTSDRRHVMKTIGRVTTLAALPLALGAMFNKAYGKTTTAIADILNFALTLEYLEAAFYTKALANHSLIPAADQPAFVTIGNHEKAHVDFLRTTIATLSGVAIAEPTFDFTAGGMYSGVFSDYPTFLALSQAFEDTGVRAYKGQAANLQSNSAVLTAALQIHSIEARHAAHVREIRAANGATLNDGITRLKPWITGAQSGIPGLVGTNVSAVYTGEDNMIQASINIVGLDTTAANTQAAVVNIDANAASEAFDEPLDMISVQHIIKPFMP